MICKKCYHEFGSGDFCQNCNIDKVVGLGSYTGYDVRDAQSIIESVPQNTPRRLSTINTPENDTTPINPGFAICYKCANAIPSESEFCPSCGLKLYTKCPKCENKYSSQYSFCNRCGVNAEDYLAEQQRKAEQARIEQERAERARREEEERRRRIEAEEVRRKLEEERRRNLIAEETRRLQEEQRKKNAEERRRLKE